MKKRMFLSTILMTLVLLVAVTTSTFAWYVAQLNSSTTTATLTTTVNNTSTTSMIVTASATGLNGATPQPFVYTDTNGVYGTPGNITTATSYESRAISWATSTSSTHKNGAVEMGTVTYSASNVSAFLPVTYVTSADYTGVNAKTSNVNAKQCAATTGGAFHSYVYDGSANFTEDKATQGIAYVAYTIYIKFDQYASDQQLTLSMKTSQTGYARNVWGYSYDYTSTLYSVNSASTAYTKPTAASYTPHEMSETNILLAGFCAPKTQDLTLTVIVFLNGGMVTDSASANANGSSLGITFGLAQYVGGATPDTVSNVDLTTSSQVTA